MADIELVETSLRDGNQCLWAALGIDTAKTLTIAPVMDQLAAESAGRYVVAKLNVDENPNVPGRFAVRGIPTLLLFKEGQLAETIVGLRAKEDIAQMIERHLGA